VTLHHVDMDWLAEQARSRKYPTLPQELKRQLQRVTPTDGLYYPCKVTLASGGAVDCVYFAEAERWFRTWGVWPDEDSGKRWLDVGDVRAIEESPSRLPPKFADQLYEAGESGMGYTLFIVCFRDGTTVPFGTGNAIDFIRYPPGQSPETVARVIPHAGRGDRRLESTPEYYWCLYSDG
jgi:hypothetical protein